MPIVQADSTRLKEFTMVHLGALFAMLPPLFSPSVKLVDFVGLVLGEGCRDHTEARPYVALVLRTEVGMYLGADDVGLLPDGDADALTLFVMNRGERSAFPVPISGELRRLLARAAPGASAHG